MASENKNCLYGLYVLSQIIGLLSIILSVYWIFAYNGGLGFEHKTLLNWHPIFLSIGMVFLLGNGIMTFRIWHHAPRKTLKLVHFGMNALGLVCVLLGAVAVIGFKFHTGELQFYSSHSWIGLLGILLYLVQAVVSIGALLLNCVSDEAKAALLPYHVFYGQVIFASGIVSIITGFYELALKYLRPDYDTVISWGGVIVNSTCILCAFYGILVVYITTAPKYKRKSLPEEEALLGGNQY